MEAELQLDLPIAIAAPLVLICLASAPICRPPETAVTGTSRPRMHRLASRNNRRAAMVNGLLDRKDEGGERRAARQQRGQHPSRPLTTAVLTAIFGAAGVVCPRSSSAFWW